MRERHPVACIPVPNAWPAHIHSAILHASSLAHWAITHTRSWCANSPITRVRQAGEIDQLRNDISTLNEELRIKSARMARIPAHQRPHYAPIERLAILQLKASTGWSIVQTARRFLLDEETISMWQKRHEDRTLLSTGTPINKLPDFVSYIVQQLKVTCPTMGKKRIAQILGRAGLVLSTTTVGRFIKQHHRTPTGDKPSSTNGRTVTAKKRNHVWHVDLTIMPTNGGFFTTWRPWCLPPIWPFAYWVAVVVDHYSRTAIGFAVFSKAPSAAEVQAFLDAAISQVQETPKHIISDRGKQFDCRSFRSWCKQRKILNRYGAVGKNGSIAIVERFIRSMKTECLRVITTSLQIDAIRGELSSYFEWYNTCRPHQALLGRAPIEVYRNTPKMKTPYGTANPLPKLELSIRHLDGKQHLPIVKLRKAA